MHYYIDGYNLMFRVLRAGGDLQAKREQIIKDLSEKILFLGLDATLVFDSQYQAGEGSRSHIQHLEIQYTAQGQTADEFILEELKRMKYPATHIVVTSDRQLARSARLRQAQTETIEHFLESLNKRFKNKRVQQKKATKPELPKKEVALPKKKAPSKPTKKTSLEGCFDFYLEAFEKEYEKIKRVEPPRPQTKKKSSKKSSRRPQKKPKSEEDDMTRWLKVFQRNPEEDFL